MQFHSKVATCCFALVLIVACTLLSSCSYSSFKEDDYDLASKECSDTYLLSMPEGQRVFLDPTLSHHDYAPIVLRGVEEKLTQLEDSVDGKIRFRVITKQINKLGDQLGKYMQSPAQLLSPLVLETAKRSDSFPDDNYVLILITRSAGNVQSLSMETTCSPALLAVYPSLSNLIERRYTTSVQVKADKLLPNPLDEAVLLVAREITNAVAQAEKTKSAEEEAKRKAEEAQQTLIDAAKRAEDKPQKPRFGILELCLGLVLGAGLTLLGTLLFKRNSKNW